MRNQKVQSGAPIRHPHGCAVRSGLVKRETHGLSGLAVFEHYLKRLSQRGWGLFSFVSADVDSGHAQIALKNSSFVLQQPGVSGKLCYMFEGWFAGAMDWVGKDTGHSYATVSRETQCAAEGHDHCIFTVTPKAD